MAANAGITRRTRINNIIEVRKKIEMISACVQKTEKETFLCFITVEPFRQRPRETWTPEEEQKKWKWQKSVKSEMN